MSNSDYTKERTNLFELLPEVYRSDVNRSLLETVFNRFLSKSELERVIGYIGQGNPNALTSRQIQEFTPHRQAYQLQPMIYSKVGSVEHMASWKDIQVELERLGVGLNRMKEWGNAKSFNWAPPVDYDKILNYVDYYWYNETDPSDSPQYVTIQNPCVRAEAKLDEYQNVLDEFGSLHPIVALDGLAKTISIEGDLTTVFTEGLVFFVKNSSNSTINNEYFATVSSSYVPTSNRTVVVVSVSGSPPFNDAIVDGDVSLEELLFVFQSERDCACTGDVGWSVGLWDDNQIGNVIWNAELLTQISWPTESAWQTANCTALGSPCPETNDLWYDTTADQLKQYNGSAWVVVQNNFSEILAATTGKEFWDLSESCEVVTNPWIEENKWLHKNQVPNFTIARQAQMPIIEFLPTVALNSWSETSYEWKYRASSFDDFAETDATPELFELAGVDDYMVLNAGSPPQEIILDGRYGNLTTSLPPGSQFNISGDIDGNDGLYTVAWSKFCQESLDQRFVTHVKIVETFNAPTVASPATSVGTITPALTSQGDAFLGLYDHWLYVRRTDSLPVNHQPLNPMLEFPTNPPLTAVAGTYWDYVLGLYAEEFTLTTSSLGLISIIDATPGTGSPANTWKLAGNHVSAFTDVALGAVGGTLQTLVVEGNSGSGNGEYTITGVALDGADTLVSVAETITPAAASAAILGQAYVHWSLILDSSLQYSTLPNTNEIRVYIDGVRQYGVYDEIDISVNGSPIPICDKFVGGALMQTPVSAFQTIRVEVGAATASDIGYEVVAVRTEEDDALFTVATGVDCVSLVKYRKLEQTKTQTQQYPLFELFSALGGTTNRASKIFAFQESQDYSVSPIFGRRIVTDGSEYYFEQFLIDEDDGPLFAYCDSSAGGSFWFDTDENILYRWTGRTWDRRILTSAYATPASTASPPLASIGCYAVPVVSATVPGEPWIGINGMIWFNTNNNTIYVSDGSTWNESALFTSATIFSSVDPFAITIWRSGPDGALCQNRTEYIPEYVDAERDPVTIGSQDGDWEIPNQLYYNPLHENRKVLSLTQLISHFLSIISEQDVPPGFSGDGQTLFHALTDINFGLGGTIKEYNDSYDTFLSSIFVQNVTPIQLYEFAHDAYENALNSLKEYFRSNVQPLMTDISQSAVADLGGTIADVVIEAYEQNDFASLVFGDSNTYNQATGQGVRNWPATLPFVRMAFKVKPKHFYDSELDLNEIRHHDGHLSHISFSATSVEGFVQRILNTDDLRVTNPTQKMGTQSTSAPPATFAGYQAVFGNTSACYWYDVGSVPGERTLYRMAAVRVGNVTPSTALPEGTYWYDTSVNKLKVLTASSSPVIKTYQDAGAGVGLLTDGTVSAWEVVSVDGLFAETILEVETRLYEVAPNLTSLSHDFQATLSEDASLTATYYEEAFFEFLVQAGITAPFDNSDFFDEGDYFTWNYKTASYPATGSSPGLTPKLGENPVAGGTWQDVYQKNYGTPYPHLEPWKLQGYASEPAWWQQTYADTTGTRTWLPVMWSNILAGTVPSGRFLPDGDVSSGAPGEVQIYNYVPVNIFSVAKDDADANSYEPDELLPPVVTLPADIRSIFTSPNEVPNRSQDYQYDDAGLVEWTWENSSQFLYDTLKVAFRIQPVRFIHDTLGEEFVDIGCLQVSTRTQKVYAHQDALFHGDLLADNTTASFEGTLQWYSNFNRFNGYDLSTSNFRPLWVDWVTYLAYQFSTVIDTQSFLIFSNNFDVVSQDYNLTLKRSPGIEDHWVDALKTTLVQSPPNLIRFDTESQWVFDLDSYSPIGRRLTYYASRQYGFTVDGGASPVVDTMSFSNANLINRSLGSILSVSSARQEVVVEGDITFSLKSNNTFEIVGNSGVGVDGEYIASNVSLNDAGNTVIELNPHASSVIPSTAESDGTVQRFLWEDGQAVLVSSDGYLPSPLQTDTFYYFNKVSSSQFSLSEQAGGPVIDILSQGTGNHTISQIDTSFQALGGQTVDRIWYRYALDKTRVNSSLPPVRITGVQNMISIINGYAEYEEDMDNFRFNYNSTDVDSQTGRVINWQLETERFIDWAYQSRSIIQRRTNAFGFSVDSSSDEFSFDTVDGSLHAPGGWNTGQAVVVSAGSGSNLPSPLLQNTIYYFIRVSNSVFKLAITRRNATQGFAIDVLTDGSGELVIREVISIETRPIHEINPFRNNLWVSTPVGILSDMFKGPFFDVRTDQLLFDQFGRRLPSDRILVLREDKLSQITVQEGIDNDVVLSIGQFATPYNDLHLTSAHVFVDGYEHVILFNNYASNGNLIYDPFIGLNVSKFDVQFDRSTSFTLRPVLGGYVLLDNRDKDGTNSLVRNIEGQVDDLRYLYDTYRVIESNNLVEEGRASLGYDGLKDYLLSINIKPKSQFIFWRGLIQQKGSVNSVKAFINSRRFVDAKIDEFWAYKVADFGDAREYNLPEVNLFAEDARIGDIRLHFVEPGESADTGFISVANNNQDRWYEYPDQRDFFDSNGNMYFNVRLEELLVSPPGSPSSEYIEATTSPYTYVYELPYPADGITIVDNDSTASPPLAKLTAGTDYDFLNSRTVAFKNGIDPRFRDFKYILASPYESKHNPCKIRDVKEEATVAEVILWDPARDEHYPLAINLVDVQKSLEQSSENGETFTYQTLVPDTQLFFEDFESGNLSSWDNYVTSGSPSGVTVSYELSPGNYVLKVVNDIQDSSNTNENLELLALASINVGLGANPQSASFKFYVESYGSDDPGTIQFDSEDHSEVIMKFTAFRQETTDSFRRFHVNDNPYSTLKVKRWYRVNISNINFETHTFDFEVLDDNGILVDSDTGVDFVDELDELNYVSVFNQLFDAEVGSPPAVVPGVILFDNIEIRGYSLGILSSPAIYPDQHEYQMNSLTGEVEEVYADYYNPWGAKEVGTTWLDTTELGFVPYSDQKIFSNVFDRLTYWGRLAGWASYRMYQWTESDVPPDEYDSTAEEQEGDISIDEQERVTGRVRKEIWKSISSTGISSETTWNPYQFMKYDIGSKIYYSESDIVFDISSDEPASLYKNEVLFSGPSSNSDGLYESAASVTQEIMSGSPDSFSDKDFITVVRFQPSDDQIDGETYKQVTPYSTEQVLVQGVPTTKYYFWVENKTVVETKRNKDLSMLQAVYQLENIPMPYVVPQKLVGSVLDNSPSVELLPRRYTQAILRNFGVIINEDDRYVLRFTRDFTLRDTLRDYEVCSTELKTRHQEWELFRKNQEFNVPRQLWNLMMEAIIGQTYNSTSESVISPLVRVPSLDRELYDIDNNTQTRIGLGTGQAFADGEQAYNAILQYLQDGDNDFTPADINSFFETHDPLNLTPRTQSDAQAIADMLNEIYNSFTYENVNGMFFQVLYTAVLPFQNKYKDLMKTSWVALHGIRVLATAGLFDD